MYTIQLQQITYKNNYYLLFSFLCFPSKCNFFCISIFILVYWNHNHKQLEVHCNFHILFFLWLQDFGYGEKYYSVLEVNKTSYKKCVDTGFIKNVTGGAGRDVFELKEAKTYYFMSGGGFCWQGLKVVIKVIQHVAPPPQHVSSESKSASDFCQVNQTLVMLILVFIWGILFK
ncbi:putative cupredoxin [Lupinus albus]|uniref:Putative cupredoxin n=1 Tax=Lupinus albus TaxID=3870 RepID=A0A6A4PY92_LUPAL|nr:putative cupredoxin [Lupinus albus]